MPTGAEIATAWVRLVPSFEGGTGVIAKELVPAAEKAGDDAGKKAGSKFTAGLKVAAVAGAALVAGAVVKTFQTGMEELKFGEQVSAQTDQLIKNTGFKMATSDIEDFTLALSKVSGVSEEELQQAGNNLIKFGDLSEENYKKAVESINDLAGSGKDASGVSEALGKALADPAKAAGLLKRQGVVLTDQQKDLIKTLSESGDKAGAQNVILEALEKTYGGMAETAGNTLTGQMNRLNNSWENVAGNLVSYVMPAITAVVEGLMSTVNWLEQNDTWVMPLATGLGILAAGFGLVYVAAGIQAAGGLKAYLSGTKLVTAAQAVMNAVMAANPLALVVIAIAAVVGALVWFFTQTELGRKLWGEFMNFMGEVWANIQAGAVWLWENGIRPAFEGIAAVATWLWENVLRPIVDLVVNYFRFWGAVAVWLYENAVKPVMNWIADAFEWVWNTIIKPVIDWVVGYLKLLGLGFTILYRDYVKPAIDNVSNVLSTVWAWIDRNVFTPFKDGLGLIGKAFEFTARAIGEQWDKIKRAAAVPINFVLDTVWNNGLRSFWNDMVGTLGLSDMKLPAASLIRFANGSEDHRAQIAKAGAMRLWAEPETGGEAYIPLAPSKRGRSTEILARVASKFGYDLTQHANGSVTGDGIGDVWGFLTDPVGSVASKVVDGIIKPLLGGAGDSVFGRLAGQLPVTLVNALAGKIKESGAGGRAGMGWQAMWAAVQRGLPGAVMTSNYRPGATTVNGGQSYHALGRAIDLIPATMETFNAVARMFPNASELIYTPAGNRQLQNGRPFSGWSSAVKAQHYNHVHLAMANGGILPGLMNGGTVTRAGSVLVGERGPEVLSLPRGAQVDPDISAGRGRGGVTQYIYPQQTDPRVQMREWGREAERALASE